jgi:hypothetical protein
MRRCFLSLTALALGTALAVGGSGAAGAATVSPTTFTTTVCAAIATSAQTAEAQSSALSTAAAAYKASPSPTTAAALRDALTQTMQSLDQQTTDALTAIQQAGTPTGGKSFVKALTSEFQQAHNLAQRLTQHAAAIDVSSSSTFTATAQQVAKEADDAGTKLKKAAKSNPAFKKAARAYRPLVTFMTTDAKTCPKS